MPRPWPYLVLLCLLFGTASPSWADWLRLGSWNIEHLGEEDEETVPVALAELFQLAGVDILALEEIYDNDGNSNTRTNSQLDQALAILNEIDGNDWVYEMLPNRFSGDKSQLVVLAWNRARVAKVGDALRIDIKRDDKEWDRHPHAVKFSAGSKRTDIVVIPLHMKADYKGDFSDQRELEARKLVDELPAVRAHFSDQDLVLIGDLNCGVASEGALDVFYGAGFTDLNARDAATHVRYGPLDRALVVKAQPEFRFSRQYIITAADEEAFDQYLSDHQMIMISIRVQEDDD